MFTLYDRVKMEKLLLQFNNDSYLAQKFYTLLLQFSGQDMTPEVFVLAVNRAMKAFLNSLDNAMIANIYANTFAESEFDIMDCMAPKDVVSNISEARLRELLAKH